MSEPTDPKYPTMIQICINTEPVKDRHVGWKVEVVEGKHFVLYEIVERFYDHPDAEGMALIQRYEVDEKVRYRINDPRASSLQLMYSIQNTISREESPLTCSAISMSTLEGT